jgi:hypothetical protein
LFVNGFTMGRIYNEKLAKLISMEASLDLPSSSDITKLKRGLQRFQITQLLIFVLIIVMVVFKFS